MAYIAQVFSVSLILFSVIDIIGSLPIVIDLRNRAGEINSRKTTLCAGSLMIAFLFIGEGMLHLLGTDVASFAIAGAIVLLAIGVEMVMGIRVFREDVESFQTTAIVPLAFPLIAGVGTLTTILSLKSEYSHLVILTGIAINLVVIYYVLGASSWIESRLGPGGLSVVRKVFGIVLLSIAIKLLKANLF